MRRTALLAGLALLMAGGCAQVNRVLDLTGTVAGVPVQPIGPDRLRVALSESGARATLAPVARSDDVTVWQTRDGITLSFRDGLLIATRGLGDDLMSADVAGTRAMLRAPATALYHLHIRTYLDGEDRTLYRRYQCRETARSEEGIEIEGAARRVTRVEMGCAGPDGAFDNIYWLDRQGVVVKSRQWVSPVVGYMEAEPAAPAVTIRVGP